MIAHATGPFASQGRLLEMPMVGLYPVDPDEVNRLLIEWEHKLGPCNRPFRQEGYVLEHLGRPVACAMSASLVSDEVAGTDKKGQKCRWRRQEAVELARLAGEPWATRVMIRLWRQTCGPSWKNWPARVAVSYSKNSMHTGDLYRFDGWERIKTDAGSSGGGSWSRERYASEAVYGSKSLWIWRYPIAAAA